MKKFNFVFLFIFVLFMSSCNAKEGSNLLSVELYDEHGNQLQMIELQNRSHLKLEIDNVDNDCFDSVRVNNIILVDICKDDNGLLTVPLPTILTYNTEGVEFVLSDFVYNGEKVEVLSQDESKFHFDIRRYPDTVDVDFDHNGNSLSILTTVDKFYDDGIYYSYAIYNNDNVIFEVTPISDNYVSKIVVARSVDLSGLSGYIQVNIFTSETPNGELEIDSTYSYLF